ncbi:hypothetical protein QYF61_015863 [Mycteria americana]|uniref:Uncharacterized protein n=1 Tax=Mycteria americana TaxID=33587 RepID=A0AAN7S143_MYCAM|nr:hypothetical protein QYF61_015863 [Mycteria americana]
MAGEHSHVPPTKGGGLYNQKFIKGPENIAQVVLLVEGYSRWMCLSQAGISLSSVEDDHGEVCSIIPVRVRDSIPGQKDLRATPILSPIPAGMGTVSERLRGEHIVTWLLRSWDNRASSLELEGREAKQVGSLSRQGGIDKEIGKGAEALSLWRRLLSGMKERYPFKEDVIYHPGKWTTTERGVQYLRELAVLEVIYDDLDNKQLSKDPDEVKCT